MVIKGGRLSLPGAPPFRERLGKVGRGLCDDLVRIAPDHFTLVRGCDRAHRQATLLKQPGAIAPRLTASRAWGSNQQMPQIESRRLKCRAMRPGIGKCCENQSNWSDSSC
jgi:hypothetical protein